MLDGRLDALVNNAGISPKGDGRRAAEHPRPPTCATWGQVFHVNFFAPVVLARGLKDEVVGGERRGGQRHLDRRHPGASVRRRGLCHLEGGAEGADPRDGA